MKEFTFIDLFAGIGGFRGAIDELGGTCVFSSEFDPKSKVQYNQIAYQNLYGDKPHGDITKINPSEIPDHDLIVGGFPCQSFSIAGKRAGFADETRGTLFFNIVEIMKNKKPKMALLENVKGLISHDKGKTLNTIISALSEVGYLVDFEVLNSKFFGVPQNRERIFIVAIREDLHEQDDWKELKKKNVVYKAKKRIQEIEGVKTFNFDFPQNDEVTTRLKDILETNVDERFYLSEEKTAKLISQLKEKSVISQGDEVGIKELGKLNEKRHSSLANSVVSTEGMSPTLDTMSGGGREPKIAEMIEPPFIVHNIYGGFDEKEPRIFKDESPTIRTPAGGGRLPTLLERVEEPSLKCVGNVNPSGRGMNGSVYDVESGLSPTLSTNKGEGTKMFYQYRIRKLTPLECLRLQGFKDSEYEAIKHAKVNEDFGLSTKDFNRVNKNGISDSQIYKMAGNAVTRNVITAITKPIIDLL